MSNKFTLARIIAAPVIFLIYFLPMWFNLAPGNIMNIVSICFIIPFMAFAEFTDYLDGHFARKHHEVSDFGKMFDPFADVFLHLSMFTCFVFSGYMHPVFYILILYREFSQNFLRMVAAKTGTAIAARKGGKFKTVFYVFSCFFVLVQELLIRTNLVEIWNIADVMPALKVAGQVVFCICVVLSYASFVDYLKNFGHVLKEAANDKGN